MMLGIKNSDVIFRIRGRTVWKQISPLKWTHYFGSIHRFRNKFFQEKIFTEGHDEHFIRMFPWENFRLGNFKIDKAKIRVGSWNQKEFNIAKVIKSYYYC